MTENGTPTVAHHCPACGRAMNRHADGWHACVSSTCGLWWKWEPATGTFARLVNVSPTGTHEAIKPGSELTSYLGEVFLLEDGDPPTEWGKTGRVTVCALTDFAEGEWRYPAMFGLMWSVGHLYTVPPARLGTYRAPGVIGGHAPGGSTVFEFVYSFANEEGAEFTVVGDDYTDACRMLALWAHGNPKACPPILAAKTEEEAQFDFADIVCAKDYNDNELCIYKPHAYTERAEKWTERERAEMCITGAMLPEVIGPVDAYTVQFDNGDEYVATTDADVPMPAGDGESVTITLHKDVWLGRLSMPGYMDCTEWTLFDGEDEDAESVYAWLYEQHADEYDPAEPREDV